MNFICSQQHGNRTVSFVFVPGEKAHNGTHCLVVSSLSESEGFLVMWEEGSNWTELKPSGTCLLLQYRNHHHQLVLLVLAERTTVRHSVSSRIRPFLSPSMAYTEDRYLYVKLCRWPKFCKTFMREMFLPFRATIPYRRDIESIYRFVLFLDHY